MWADKSRELAFENPNVDSWLHEQARLVLQGLGTNFVGIFLTSLVVADKKITQGYWILINLLNTDHPTGKGL